MVAGIEEIFLPASERSMWWDVTPLRAGKVAVPLPFFVFNSSDLIQVRMYMTDRSKNVLLVRSFVLQRLVQLLFCSDEGKIVVTRLFCDSDLSILHQSSWKWALRSKGMK